jgi:hypothetical protein
MIGIAAIMRDATARFEELRALRKELAARPAGINRRAARRTSEPNDGEDKHSETEAAGCVIATPAASLRWLPRGDQFV